MEAIDATLYQSRMEPWIDTVLAVYLIMIGIVSIVLNGLGVFVLRKNKHALKKMELFIINLQAADLGMTLLAFPFIIDSLLNHRWRAGDSGCYAYAFLSFLFGYQDLLALMLLALMRCLCIRKNLLYKKISVKQTVMMIIGAFLTCVGFAAFPFSPYASYGPEQNGVNCSIDWIIKENLEYVITVFVCCFLLPMMVMLICYTNIGLFVYKNRRNPASLSATTHPGSAFLRGFFYRSDDSPELDVARMTCAMWLGFFISWSPYAIITFLSAFYPHWITPVASILPAVFCKTTVVINPIIYNSMSKLYRKRCKEALLTHRALLLLCQGDSASNTGGEEQAASSSREELKVKNNLSTESSAL